MSEATQFDARTVYAGSDADATRALYAHLETIGPVGIVAMNLFRASKCSGRAKDYRRYRARYGVKSRWTRDAYDRKSWSLANLCEVLDQHGATLGIAWGWKSDPATPGFPWVLYLDLPTGQVSFHADRRGVGPDYPRDWDGMLGKSPYRVVAWPRRLPRPCARPYAGTSSRGIGFAWKTARCGEWIEPMRNMSFSKTVKRIKDRSKTVTRRLGWSDLKPGELFWAIEKGQGLKRGEKVQRLALLRCVSNEAEPIEARRIRRHGPDEVRREGFPGMSVRQFVAFFCREMAVREGQMVRRIEFEYVQ